MATKLQQKKQKMTIWSRQNCQIVMESPKFTCHVGSLRDLCAPLCTKEFVMPLFYHLFNNFAQICAGKEYFLVPLHPEKRK